VATGGGGYQWARVVPRAWTLYFAEMADRVAALPDKIPEAWLRTAEDEAGEPLPRTLSDGAVTSRGNEGSAGWVVDEIRRRIFPTHGLT
jgi:hypothetical protein